MFKKIPIILSLLFFLVGTNVFAQNDVVKNHSSKELKLNVDKQTAAVAVKSKTTATQDENKPIDYVIPGSILFIIVVGIGSYWLVYRRKHV